MDDCLSRIIVQSIKDELGHWDDLKEEQCESDFVYVSAEEVEQQHGSYASAAGRDEAYPTEGCDSPFPPPPPHCDPLLESVKRDWGAGPNHVAIKQERPDDDEASFHKEYEASSPDQPDGDSRCQPVHDSPGGCWNGGFHPPYHPPVEYIELKPKVRHVSPPPGTGDCDGGVGDGNPPPPPDHRPELAYVLVERLPLRVLQAWLPPPDLPRGKRRHSSLSLETKLRILRDVGRSALPKKEIALKYEIPQSTLSTLIRNRDKIEESFAAGVGPPGRCRSRGAKHGGVEARLYRYFADVRARNVRVSGQMLQEEAGRIATRMGVDDFAASAGWLWRFQKRYNIAAPSPPPGGDAAPDARDDWLRSVRHLLGNYRPRDTFAASELALYYNATPDRTDSLRFSRCGGGERSLDRLTVALASNADGSEKLRPVVVGKFATPRCLRRVGDRAAMPCLYRSSKHSWMTGGLFSEWLATLQRRMEEAGRKILLVAADCRAHRSPADGSRHPNVRLLLLPPDTAHPLGGGVARAFKRTYRQRLVRHYLHQVRSGVALTSLRKWDTLDAMTNIAASWEAVTPASIRRGWAGSRLLGDGDAPGAEEEGETGEGGKGEWDPTPSQMAELGVASFEALVEVDDEVATSSLYDEGAEESAATPAVPHLPPPPPTREELACAVGVLDRVATTYRVPAKVLRAIRVLDRYVADVTEPAQPAPAQRDADAWSRQTV